MSNRNRKTTKPRPPRPAPPPGVDIDIADVWAILQRKAANDQVLALHMENAMLQAALDAARQPDEVEGPELELVEDDEDEPVEGESG